MSPCLTTHIDDPVLGVVGVGAAHVQPVVAHGLDHADVVPAFKVLGRQECTGDHFYLLKKLSLIGPKIR